MPNNNNNNNRGRSSSKRRWRNNKKKGKGNTPADKEYKFAIHTQNNAARYHTFDMVKKKLLEQMSTKDELIDVVEALRNMKEYDWEATMPQRVLSTIDVFDTVDGKLVKNPRKEDQRKVMQDGLDSTWNSERDQHLERKETYRKGMASTFGVMYWLIHHW